MLTSNSVEVFVCDHTQIATPDLCPEISLHLADDMDSVWKAQEIAFNRSGSPPYWSLAWVGGQALARYTLDHPWLVRDRSVVDVGSGCGICAIAASKAGARSVAASDVDVFSRDVLSMNARLNGVHIEVLREDVIGFASHWDVVLVADLWYERFLAARLNAWLREIARRGSVVLLGDCGRAHFPRRDVTLCERYNVPAPPLVEREAVVPTGVWRIH